MPPFRQTVSVPPHSYNARTHMLNHENIPELRPIALPLPEVLRVLLRHLAGLESVGVHFARAISDGTPVAPQKRRVCRVLSVGINPWKTLSRAPLNEVAAIPLPKEKPRPKPGLRATRGIVGAMMTSWSGGVGSLPDSWPENVGASLLGGTWAGPSTPF